jgi:hypothetical protein
MHSPDIRASATLHRPNDLRLSTLTILFGVLMVMAAIPVITHSLPPLSDYINHLGRTYVINHIGTDPDLARFYAVKWNVVPNLMIDIAMMVLHPFMDIYRAGQVFTITAFVLIISGTLALNRVLHGGWSALPLIGVPLLYNEVLLVGVMNYVFGIGLTLWAFVAWVALRDRAWPWRYVVSTLFATGLFFCHLYAVGLYAVVVAAFEMQRLLTKQDEPFLRRLLIFAASGLPFLPVVVLLARSPTWGAVNSYSWTMDGKLDGLVFAVNAYYPVVALGLVAVVAAAALWALRRRLLHMHPAGWFVLFLGTLVYLAMPRSLFGAFMADQRLPIALAFVLIACLRLEFRYDQMRHGFIAIVVVLLAARVVEVQTVWDRLAAGMAEFARSVSLIDRGARVLVVHGDRSAGGLISDYGLVHAASLATIERSALVSTTFTVRGKQVLKVKEEYRKYVETEDRTPPGIPYFVQAASADVPYFFTRWPSHFDYVYILFTKRGAANPDPRDMTRIFDGANFQLFRIHKQG